MVFSYVGPRRAGSQPFAVGLGRAFDKTATGLPSNGTLHPSTEAVPADGVVTNTAKTATALPSNNTLHLSTEAVPVINGFLEQVDASQEESDADSAEAHTVFDLMGQRCGSGTGTMDDYEAVDDDIVICRKDTLADILKEAAEGTGDESEEMDSDDHQSAPLTSKASQAVELLQWYFQKEGYLEHVCNLNKMNAQLVKQCHTKLKQATMHSFFGGCDL
ncbi:hypothetical protein HPB50_012476 [Hyalomma asiaticum]|uniref:Uncharacterized protein n=1 Tax=Hyalomma asiaticum TaxID=266040 RepID=A0ACB7TGH5_HYAAI|nr:hypothetical protein HPB50_012476 [Hyalomma asiaticum]